MRFTTIAGQSLAVEAVPLLEPERNIIRESLCHRDAGRAHLAIVDAYGRLERRIQTAIESSGMIPACHPGCGWCCHGVKVNVTALEALVVAEHLNHESTSLVEAVQAAAARRRTMNTDQLFASKDACPFLDSSNQCQIYEVRPSACRRHCCMDASECERAVSNPELKLAVTQHAPANVAGALSALAWAAAMEDAHLDYRTFELTSAVAVALQPGAAERWVRGERVFDAAARAVDEQDQATIRAELGKSSGCVRQVAPLANTWKRHGKKRRQPRS